MLPVSAEQYTCNGIDIKSLEALNIFSFYDNYEQLTRPGICLRLSAMTVVIENEQRYCYCTLCPSN